MSTEVSDESEVMPKSEENLNLKVLNSIVEKENKSIQSERIVYEQFLQRLDTFVQSYGDPRSERKWLFKPKEISPPICAKYGWQCVGKDLIECSSCKKQISGSLPKVWERSVYQECVNEITKKITNGHQSACPWLKNPVPDRFIVMKLGHKENELQDFKVRLQQLLDPLESIPAIHGTVELKMDWNSEYYDKIAQYMNVTLNKVVKSAILLAITGWSRVEKTLRCNCCLRSIGISYYAQSVLEEDSNKSDENISEESVENPPKRQRLLDKFDPLFEHRDWCLWVTLGEKESADKENVQNEPVLGWKMYQKFIVDHVTKPSDNDRIPTNEDILNATSQLRELFDNLEGIPIIKDSGEE